MLIPSKLSRPVRLDHTVVRERLLAKLSGAHNFRLALVTSPAGYGKTTLISQWAAGKSDLGWYSLDEGDNQQERFASYLIAAIQQATNGHCVTSEVMVQKRQYASLSSLFSQLFIELAEWHRPLYVVIDDYHLITNPVIHESMRFFLRHQPENLTLVVLSRNLPQLGIANLRVRDQLLEIGSQQLAFTHQEAKQFFDCRLTSPIEASESSRLCDDVAGWATALQLIALSARQNNSPTHQSARRLAGINASHLSDYLVDEVLNSVDLTTRHFLLKSSLLRSMNDALIVRVTGIENGQLQLEEIERQGLFLTRMDDPGEWFSYHPLFGSFLRQRCQWEMAAELPEIHRAAAESWMAQGFPSEGYPPCAGRRRCRYAARYSAQPRVGTVQPQRTDAAGRVVKSAAVGEPAGESASGAAPGLADAEPASLQRSEHPAGARRAGNGKRDGCHPARRI